MPWKSVTVIKQRQKFLEDRQLYNSSIAELAGRSPISRKTIYSWINRPK
jgi:transposase